MEEQESERYRAYLLGRLPEEDAERLETDLLNDDDLYHRIGSVEVDLIDAYTAGRLSEADRAAFLLRFRGEGARERLAFSEALRAKSRRSNVVPLRRRRSYLSLAAAAAVAMIALALAYVGSRPNLPQAPPESASAPAIEPRTIEAPRLVSFTVAIGTATRSERKATSIEVPEQAATIELVVPLDPAETFERYSIELRDAGGTVVWKQSSIVPVKGDGGLVATTRVPAGEIRTGAYELALAGERDGAAEDLGFEPLKVRRIP